MGARRIRLAFLSTGIWICIAGSLAYAETITSDNPAEGSSTWPDGDAGLKGVQVGTNGAEITVTTTTTVGMSYQVDVIYQIGVVVGGTFHEWASYKRTLLGGTDQQVSNTFSGLSRGTEYTVKAKVVFPSGTKSFTDRTKTVPP